MPSRAVSLKGGCSTKEVNDDSRARRSNDAMRPKTAIDGVLNRLREFPAIYAARNEGDLRGRAPW